MRKFRSTIAILALGSSVLFFNACKTTPDRESESASIAEPIRRPTGKDAIRLMFSLQTAKGARSENTPLCWYSVFLEEAEIVGADAAKLEKLILSKATTMNPNALSLAALQPGIESAAADERASLGSDGDTVSAAVGLLAYLAVRPFLDGGDIGRQAARAAEADALRAENAQGVSQQAIQVLRKAIESARSPDTLKCPSVESIMKNSPAGTLGMNLSQFKAMVKQLEAFLVL